MKKLNCTMRVENDQERKAMMAWVAMVANGGYSELGDTIHLTYLGDPTSDNGRYWGIVHTVEHYAEHTIESTDA